MASPTRVWEIRLDQPEAVASALEALLDPVEAALASRRTGQNRIRYIVAHGAMRSLLGTALDEDPARLQFARACEHCGHPDHGRPRLAGEADVQFSLSHSGESCVLAFAASSARLGVDIEVVAPRASGLTSLAARVLTEDELRAFRAVPSERQLRDFLVRWTRKEAYLKAIGVGVAQDLRSVPANPLGWSFVALSLGEEVVGTLASEREDLSAVLFESWDPSVP